MRLAYFDCFAGVSGDMIVGALIDLGVPLTVLEEVLAHVGFGGYGVGARRVEKAHVAATKFDVEVTGPEPARRLADIRTLIEESSLPEPIKLNAIAIFARIAEAEAKVHGVPLSEVHFHEVGATDAIVDVIAALAGLAHLGIEKVYASPVTTGSGTVATAHGVLPVPAPATLEILTGVPICGTQVQAELATPTGAAILAHIASFTMEMPPMLVERIGYGAGTRDLKIPNVLRVVLGNALARSEAVTLLETNVDDATAEVLGYTMDVLFELGALDVWFTPAQMKKSRPAVTLSALVPLGLEDAAIDAIIGETGTLGVRVTRHARVVADRETLEVDTAFGRVRVKIGRHKGRVTAVAPEYEDCRAAAVLHGASLGAVFDAARAAARARLEAAR